MAQARLKDAKRESVPDLQLRAGEQYNGEQVSENPVKASRSAELRKRWDQHSALEPEPGQHRSARKPKLSARIKMSCASSYLLRQEAAPLAQSYDSAKFEAERYKTQLIPRATRAYELYLKKYQNMAQAYPQVLVSQRTFFQLQISYLMALHDVWRNAIALQNYTLSGGLHTPMSSGSSTTTINLPNAGGRQE